MWYRLNKKPDVEYSTDYDFFKQNQILIVKSGSKYQFQSRIESKVFHFQTAILRQFNNFSDTDIEGIIKQIHTEILAGKHGEGSLVD